MSGLISSLTFWEFSLSLIACEIHACLSIYYIEVILCCIMYTIEVEYCSPLYYHMLVYLGTYGGWFQYGVSRMAIFNMLQQDVYYGPM